MPIEINDTGYIASCLSMAESSLQDAAGALNHIKSSAVFGKDVYLEESCQRTMNMLLQQKSRVAEVSAQFHSTCNTLKKVDQQNAAAYGKSQAVGNAVLNGAVVGAAASVVGHKAAAYTLNALRTALYRKGASQLHGFAFEVMFADRLNNGLQHQLFTRAVVDGTNETGKDIVLKRFGKEISKYELKATSSLQYAKKAIGKKVKEYGDSILVFTREMAEKCGVKDGGYTIAETKSVASTAKTASKGTLALQSIGKAAASSGVVGAVIDGGFEAVTGFSSWRKGEISSRQYLESIGKEALIGGVAGAVTGGILTGLATLGTVVAAPGLALTGGTALIAGAAIGGVVSWGLHQVLG